MKVSITTTNKIKLPSISKDTNDLTKFIIAVFLSIDGDGREVIILLIISTHEDKVCCKDTFLVCMIKNIHLL
jgi:hypothetical protein